MLPDTLTHQLQQTYQHLKSSGDIIPWNRLQTYYTTFRERFGPDTLAALDGQPLLYLMKGLGEQHWDGLIYWLEFKNDDEMPTLEFGSIAGGSALKYGLYHRKADDAWLTGTSHNQVEIPIDQAITIVRQHRDQLLRGVQLLQALPENATQDHYIRLQQQMDQQAPDIADSAWGHKYFYMLFPDKLDDYHVRRYQDHHAIRLLQQPPDMPGRYVGAHTLVTAAHTLRWPINHLTKVLNHRDGSPYDYWRIGTQLGGEHSIWDLMQRENCAAIGYPAVGDLAALANSDDPREQLRAQLSAHYPNTAGVIGRRTTQLLNFATKIAERDLILAAQGSRVLGIGRVTGDYYHLPGSHAPHRLPVQWLSRQTWTMPQPEGLRTTVAKIRRHNTNLIAVERHILQAPDAPTGEPASPAPPQPATPAVLQKQSPPPRLTGTPGLIQTILHRKKQVILYGPPGTGKTYWALHTARELAAYSHYGQPYTALTPDQQQTLLPGSSSDTANDKPPIRICTFHPAYGYEDFIEGYRPQTVDDHLTFQQRDGIFKRLSAHARQDPHHNYYLIIDEINRGDIPRIFGELLTILEKDKRGHSVLLPLSGHTFTVPHNLHIIATMNTADRSIALLDTALRRRFGFVELMPDSTILADTVIANTIPLGPWLDALNQRILQHIGRDARNLQIGHAYLLHNSRPVADLTHFIQILRHDIIPLLQEYTYEDYPALARILGEGLVDIPNQRIRTERLTTARSDQLIQALLATAPELATAPQLIASEAQTQQLDADTLEEEE